MMNWLIEWTAIVGQTAVNKFLWLAVYYYTFANTVYFILLIAAVFSIRKQMMSRPLGKLLSSAQARFLPPISILAPAYNEEKIIVDSVKSFLYLNYPTYEIIVLDDGSTDRTAELLIEKFLMIETKIPYDDQLSNSKAIKSYRSQIHDNLILIRKENGGKADTLNMGIGFSSHDLICSVDCDSILEQDALLKVAGPFISDPERTICCGGTIRVVNGCRVENGSVKEVKLPTKWLELLQVVEYTRSFLCGRTGWNVFNSTLIVSGAFGLFSKKSVVEVGGYEADCLGEDMELIVKLHRFNRFNKRDYSIVFTPDPVCWTEVPHTLSTYNKQRDRWQRGLAQVLTRHENMLLNPRFGYVGMFTFPYLAIIEFFGPLIEVVSLALVILGYFNGTLESEVVRMIFVAGILYSVLLTVFSLMIEEAYFSRYGQVKDFVILTIVSITESLGFRQLTSLFRVRGLLRYVMGNNEWGEMKRKGMSQNRDQVVSELKSLHKDDLNVIEGTPESRRKAM